MRKLLLLGTVFPLLLVANNACNEVEVKEDYATYLTSQKSTPVFNAEVAPIFLGVCTQCHAYGKQEGVVNPFGVVNDVQAMIDGGWIEPGSASGSKVYNRVTGKLLDGQKKMPLRGPFLTDEELLKVKNWIDLDLYVSKGETFTVNVLEGGDVEISSSSEISVTDGETVEITISSPDDPSSLRVGGTCEGKGTFSGNKYTSRRIVKNCSILLTDQPAGGGEITVTAKAAFGRFTTKEGDVPNVTFDDDGASESTQLAKESSEVSFDFTVRENDTIDTSDLDNLIDSNPTKEKLKACTPGTIQELNQAERKYRYTTGALTEDCHVTIKTAIPCPTAITEDVTFDDVNTILITEADKPCTECHYNGNQDPYFAAQKDDPLDYTLFKDAGVVELKPRSSAIYKQIDPYLNYATRMPQGGPYHPASVRSKVCKWILDGAEND